LLSANRGCSAHKATLLWRRCGCGLGWLSGQFGDLDRIDTIIRDADIEYAGAMGPRRVFALEGVAEDDAFGPDWPRLNPQVAEQIWRSVARDPLVTSVHDALRAVAASWNLSLDSVEAASLTPTARVLVVGASVTAALAEAFSGDQDLSWTRQVVVAANRPATRQLALHAAALLKQDPGALWDKPAPDAQFDHILVSEDGDPNCEVGPWSWGSPWQIGIG
jgi:hypothetical protein